MEWEVEARRALRTELTRMGVSVERLAERLKTYGEMESPKSLAVKISRGKFQMAFFMQCMAALGAESVTIKLPKADEPPEINTESSATSPDSFTSK